MNILKDLGRWKQSNLEREKSEGRWRVELRGELIELSLDSVSIGFPICNSESILCFHSCPFCWLGLLFARVNVNEIIFIWLARSVHLQELRLYLLELKHIIDEVERWIETSKKSSLR